ncbi:MAG: hypothetical protein Q4A58_02810 [Fusobacterium sp.]|uniref:hypothetical protein n=1 Tax=Fusobacterium sp. TaxID=68766 RepID=UPI0026DD4AC9|nr:hypothetical protein [Fusobacterium sp.]MDO4690208.1 hypothetical protein [Fusobacterium sp.]
MKALKIKLFNFSLIPVLLLAGLFFVSIARSNNSDIDYAKDMINQIKHLRIAIDEYYLKTGEFPDLALTGAKDELSLIKIVLTNNKEINFKDVYGSEVLAGTPEFKGLEATNKVNEVDNFKEPSFDGGWNYNKKTGEIHINLPYNFFDQSIDWNSF